MQINLKDVSYIYNEKTPYEKEVLNNKTVSTMEQIYDKSLKVYKFLA